MLAIELVFDDDCPNVDSARANLAAALSSVGCPATWREWRRSDDAAPAYAKRAGSPAILVNGHDVDGGGTGADACCRVYVGEDGRRSAAPRIDVIIAALQRTGDPA